MANISITIPDSQTTAVQEAFAAVYRYTGTAPDGAAETPAQFVRRKLREHVVEVVASHKASVAADTARAAALAQVSADLG